MLESILVESSGSTYTLLANTDQKQWLIPHRNMRTALQLYQPSAWKGKMVKVFLPLLKAFPGLLAHFNIETVHFALNPRLEEMLCKLFDTPEVEFSVFLGTPSIHKKPTLQISSGNRILGYCKASDDPDIKKLFLHEQKTLDEFGQKKVERLPQCLYCGPFIGDIWLFVQTTDKTPSSKIIHKWTDLHWMFLNQLYDKTKVKCSFEESDLADSLRILDGYLDMLPIKEARILENALFKVRDYYGEKVVQFSAYLADFTPWNTYSESGDLYAFDLEYAGKSFPPYMDFFHFITQVAIIEMNQDHVTAYGYCDGIVEGTVLERDFPIVYLSYLLTVVSFYFHLNKKPLNIDDRCYSRWLPLIQLSIEKMPRKKL